MGLSFVRFSIPGVMIVGYENFCEDAMICPVPLEYNESTQT